MGALFLTEKEMVPVRHTLTEMGWHHPPSPNTKLEGGSIGMKKITLVPCKSKSWDLRINWLRCIESQKQFR